jgi:3-methyladenine DNA glycosylase AlkD
MTRDEVIDWLERRGSKKNREGMARYGIPSERAFGVTMATMRVLAKRIGRDHELAARLWASGWHEARIMAAFIEEPALVTRAQMNAWAADFNSWALCDSVCMNLFDQVAFAYELAAKWSKARTEFVRRAGYALMASLAGHDRRAPDSRFLPFLPLIEEAGGDDRNFVKKGASWALRRIATRSPRLRVASLGLARRMAKSALPAARWIGRDASKYLDKERK